MKRTNFFILLSCFVLIIFFQNCSSQFESSTSSIISEKQYLTQLEQDSQFISSQCDVNGATSTWCECKEKGLSLGSCQAELGAEPQGSADEAMVVVEQPPTADSSGVNTSLSIQSQEVLQVNEDSVKINWLTSDYTQSYIEFGETDEFGSASIKEESFKYKNHTQSLASLKPDTKYYFRIHAKDMTGASFVSVTKFFTTLPKEDTVGPISVGDQKYLFFGGFESNEGAYASSLFGQYWGINWKTMGANGKYTTESNKSYRGRSLQVRYPGRSVSGSSRITFATGFEKLNVDLKKEVYLRYYVKLHPGWEWVYTGKFPGLAGYKSVTGGDPVSGKNGWSTRWGWFYGAGPDGKNKKKGVPIVYSYVYGKGEEVKPSRYGYKFRLHDPETKEEMVYPIDEWICLEQYLKLNDVGKPNGVIKAWMNNRQGLNFDDITFRTVENKETMIGQLLFSTFYGGAGVTYAPSKDTFASYDNFIISEQRIGCDR